MAIRLKRSSKTRKLVKQTINKIASLLVNYISRGVDRRKGLRGITWQSSGGGGAGSNKCDKLAWGGSREEEWGESTRKVGALHIYYSKERDGGGRILDVGLYKNTLEEGEDVKLVARWC